MIKQIIKSILLIAILTVLTQVGGLVYLVYLPFGMLIKSKVASKPVRFFGRSVLFVSLMSISSLVVIPRIAKEFGRVALPIMDTKEIPIKLVNLLMVITNRHYVTPELKTAILDVAKQYHAKDSSTVITYLDANFPFWTGFPLLPHLSHNDGEKLDIGFLYRNTETGKRLNASPTLFGYGFSEKPRKGEFNQPNVCEEKGYWQYSILSYLIWHCPIENTNSMRKPIKTSLG